VPERGLLATQAGHPDIALMIAQARTPPSYIYMVEQGATTLWETWLSYRQVSDSGYHSERGQGEWRGRGAGDKKIATRERERERRERRESVCVCARARVCVCV
jgi:hypothetical protein